MRIAKSYVERIEVAKKLIKESDYYKYGNNSKKIVLDLTFLKSDLRSKEAALIQDMFKKINIQLNLRPKNADQFAIITKEISYSGLLLGSINNLPDTNYYDLLSSKRIPKQINDFTGNNIFAWFNKDTNRLLEKYQTTFNAKKRRQIMRSVNEIVRQNVPLSPIYYHPQLLVLPKRILNFPFNIDNRLEYQISQDWVIKSKSTMF